ncbi:MAG: ABC transporter [Verrucomicrobia bacterium Tous-C9LFEB]|nr:MAG: ABC transporter [Verrucomicrobia bacterium Tous-C9LFEB]
MTNRSTAPILDIRDLEISRGDTTILSGVSWRVEANQHWTLLGPNGCGKTSLLSALTGYLTPTDGTVSVLGETFGESDWRELRKHVGIVSSSIRQMMNDSEPALQSVVSGKYAMIDFWGHVTAADKRRALAVLRDVEAAHLADRPWLFLSQGERQRILIGRALMAPVRLLILDEPCTGLDPLAREHFLKFLQRLALRPKGPRLVLVTHHVEEIIPAMSHVLLLKKGRVEAAGPKAKVLTSAALSKVFGATIALSKQRGRYHLSVRAIKGRKAA